MSKERLRRQHTKKRRETVTIPPPMNESRLPLLSLRLDSLSGCRSLKRTCGNPTLGLTLMSVGGELPAASAAMIDSV